MYLISRNTFEAESARAIDLELTNPATLILWLLQLTAQQMVSAYKVDSCNTNICFHGSQLCRFHYMDKRCCLLLCSTAGSKWFVLWTRTHASSHKQFRLSSHVAVCNENM